VSAFFDLQVKKRLTLYSGGLMPKNVLAVGSVAVWWWWW
jgi:hypothetical protein